MNDPYKGAREAGLQRSSAREPAPQRSSMKKLYEAALPRTSTWKVYIGAVRESSKRSPKGSCMTELYEIVLYTALYLCSTFTNEV